MWNNPQLPKFGPLSGVKVVHATLAQSGPIAAQMMADYGADVLWVENALAPDISRFAKSWALDNDRKNQRNLSLNIPTPEGKKVLLKLLEEADIFIENSKGGQYEKWGLTDEVLWEANPKLVIAHISGFGLTGLPEYVSRAALDSVAQAYSGYTFSNANPMTPPYGAPYAADFFTAIFTAMTALAALTKARETGVGESIDLAQFEIMMKVTQYLSDWLTDHKVEEQAGYPSRYAGAGVFPCKDGEFLQTYFIGAGILKKVIPLVGLEYGTEEYPKGVSMILNTSPEGKKFTEAVKNYLLTMTAKEAEKKLLAESLPVSKINTYKDVEEDPHVQARDMISEWTTFKGAKVRAASIVPKFKKHPTQIWRSAPYQGMDNEEILQQIGYSSEEIKALYDNQILTKDEEMKFCMPFSK